MAVKTDNRTTGGKFEQELAKTLYEAGFWVHVLQQNKAGQPADIIAVKGKYHTLIDCKVVSDENGFPFERVEENQRMAMKLFQRRGNELCYFAIRLPDGSIWMLAMERVLTLQERGKKRLTDAEIRHANTWLLEDWLNASEEWSKDI